MSIIETRDVIFEYDRKDEEGNDVKPFRAVDGVTLDAVEGEFIAILGSNGSGKSTFAKMLNALLIPGDGTVFVDSLDTSDPDNEMKVREIAGMVFQNPDNQMVASIVEEEVGFGPENIGVPTEEIWKRVEESLTAVGMYAYREKNPTRLSGGQKQRVAIAGILAMLPKCIVLDEPTAMLDPKGRKDVLEVLHRLNKDHKITIILITHNMEEVTNCDRIYVMDKGKIALTGTPREVFSNVEKLRELRLDVPEVTRLAYELKQAGIPLPDAILDTEEFTRQLIQAVKKIKA